jgi:hypothetical protein
MEDKRAANITVNIERIVLERSSFSRAQVLQLQKSVERELTRLLRTGGLPLHGRAEASLTTNLRGVAPQRPSGTALSSPMELGRAIGRSIYKFLNSDL